MQASFFEKKINKEKEKDEIGYLLVPVRQEEQTLYKPTIKSSEVKGFAE